jgi:spermidine synthase
MKPQQLLAQARAPDGALLTLHAHDGQFVVRADGQALMHSALAASEEQLGAMAAEAVRGRKGVHILIGGLGLGFTLRRVLDGLGAAAKAEVCVAELLPEVVEWNRTFLRELNGACMDDARVTVRTGDVGAVLGRGRWDVIALDVDNGPAAMVRAGNAGLYDERGVERLAGALRPGGTLLVWSAGPEKGFKRRLAAAGMRNVKAEPARTHVRVRSRGYVIFVAERGA